jgi:hypothetical protein
MADRVAAVPEQLPLLASGEYCTYVTLISGTGSKIDHKAKRSNHSKKSKKYIVISIT